VADRFGTGAVKNARVQIRFPALFDHQLPLITGSLKRLNFLAWGAQGGKTRVSSYLQAAYALDVGNTNNVWIDRDGKFARDAFRKFGALIPKELIKDASKIDLYYRLANDSEISFFSGLEPDAFRGKTRHTAIFNEAAFLKAEGWHEVIAPRLRHWALFNTTPKGRRNWTFPLWTEAGNHPENWFRSHYPSTANPKIPPSVIAEIKRTMADSLFRQEILAEFISDFGRFFNPNPKCWTGKFEPHDPKARYAAGLDWAKHKDYSAFAILRVDTFPRRLVCFGRLPHMDYTAQVPILDRIFKGFGNPNILADSSEDTANELMIQRGCRLEEFVFSQSSKQYVMDKLRVALEQTELLMPPTAKRIKELKDDKIVIAYPDINVYTEEQTQAATWLDDELEFFEPYLRGGRLQFGARGTHNDDLLAALMLANEHASRVLSGMTSGVIHVSTGGAGKRW
jgi:hypothetical protein